MKKLILLSILLIVGCEDYAPTNHSHTDGTTVTDTLYISYDTTYTVYDTLIVSFDTTITYNYDTTITVMDTVYIETESELIDREFVVVKSLQSASQPNTSTSNFTSGDCPSDNPSDCAGECGGDAVEQTYYYDNDGDGLGGSDYSEVFCSTNAPDNWVLNSDDDDDTIAICYVIYTINILEEDLETTNGNISFTYNEEDFLIDVSSCLETKGYKTIKIVQDTELKIFYAFDDADVEMLHYSSPNELLYVK